MAAALALWDARYQSNAARVSRVLSLQSQLPHRCPTAPAFVVLPAVTTTDCAQRDCSSCWAQHLRYRQWPDKQARCFVGQSSSRLVRQQRRGGGVPVSRVCLLRLRCRRRGKGKGALPDQPSLTRERESDSQGLAKMACCPALYTAKLVTRASGKRIPKLSIEPKNY